MFRQCMRNFTNILRATFFKFPFAKNLQTPTVRRGKLYKTLSYKKVSKKMSLKIDTWCSGREKTSMWNSCFNPELNPATQSTCKLSWVWLLKVQFRGGSGGPEIVEIETFNSFIHYYPFKSALSNTIATSHMFLKLKITLFQKNFKLILYYN